MEVLIVNQGEVPRFLPMAECVANADVVPVVHPDQNQADHDRGGDHEHERRARLDGAR